MEVRVTGINEVTRNFGKMSESVSKAVRLQVIKKALDIQRTAKQLIQQGPKTGKAYPRGGIVHIASAPGQPPATDTGLLASRVNMVVDSVDPVAYVGTNLPYGAYLEEGTANIEERPWLRPAFGEETRNYTKDIAEAVRDGTRNVTRKNK